MQIRFAQHGEKKYFCKRNMHVMANPISSPRSFKKALKDRLSTISENKVSSLPSSAGNSNLENSEFNFLYRVTDFDFCKLRELDGECIRSCDVCMKLKRKKVTTRYLCTDCNIACCVECYDFHHREQMLQALRTFRKDCPKNVDIRISEDGHFLLKKKSKTPKVTPKPSKSGELWDKICYNDMEEVINTLEKIYAAKRELMFDKNKNFRCLYFQDKQMEDFFNYYPEFVTIDVTCEIVELEVTLYLFICEDSSGHCEILAACLMRTDDPDSIMWMLDVFKKHNPNWRKMRVIVADKQIKHREIIKGAFPDSLVVLCLYHAMRAFKRDISNKDLGIANCEKLIALQIFEMMIYASSKSEYVQLHERLKSLSSNVLKYFDETWHVIREEWALGLKFNCKVFLSASNRFLLLVRRKIKVAVNVQASLVKIIKKFFSVVSFFRKERYQKFGAVFQTMPTSQHPKCSPHYKYAKLLTYYAAELVYHQLNTASTVKNLRRLSYGKYEIKGSSLIATTNTCSCSFYTLMLLPCCHIFAARKLLSLPLFVETLTSVRWIAKYYQNTYLSLHATYVAETNNHLSWSQKKAIDDNFRQSFDLTGQLLPLLSESSQDFNKRRNILRNLLTAWKQNIKVSVRIIESPKLQLEMGRDISSEDDYSIAHLKELYGISSQDNMDSDSDFSSLSLYSERSGDELSSYIAEQITATKGCANEDIFRNG